ncbi:MAG: glycosyltransferase [Candidatus Nanopelagicales bacterium]|nr:glycosyltransferase [Candidatus Nanopelagicales bacterium]
MSSRPDGYETVGQILLREKLVNELDLENALITQAKFGGQLGRILILQGTISRRQLYAAMAQQWNAPFVDLVLDPPDQELLEHLDPERLVNQGWLPYRVVGGRGVIATSVPPTDSVISAAKALLQVEFIDVLTTTDWDVDQAVATACRAALVFSAAEGHAHERAHESAKYGLVGWQKKIPIGLAAVSLIALIAYPSWALTILLTVANLTFLINVGFKVLAGMRARFNRGTNLRWEYELLLARKAQGLPLTPARIPDEELPIYTILLPVFHEANVINKLLANLGSLDYPASKLEILLLMEADDLETIEAAKRLNPPETVRLIVVPPGGPQTKPRACNYGLSFARGQFVVIYDAEDKPESGQLRDSVAAFRQDDFERTYINPNQKQLVCVQSALNYFNSDYNILTRMFAIEYSYWFDAMLPGLDQSNLPIPLGGTSNHFNTEVLRKVGAWDPYNVTEDADLGMRVSVHGDRVSVNSSTTWEEAASQVHPWIRQRTRWIKGYIMTSAVYTRHPKETFDAHGVWGSLSLICLIMGTPLAFLLYPLVLGFTVITYVGVQFIGLHLPEWLIIAGTFNMVISNSLMIGTSYIASSKRYGWRLGIFSLMLPAYWVLHAIASYRAVYQIVFDPHRWEKTPHGLSGDYVTE